MKKFLLFVMLISFVMVGMSQKRTLVELKKQSKDIISTQVSKKPAPVLNLKADNTEVTKVSVGTASDVRSVRRADTRAVSYNSELGILSVTFVLDPATYGTNPTDVGMVYSTDMGQTWSDVLVISDNSNSYTNDYPSGIVYNPVDNTDPLNAYGITQHIANQNNFSLQYKVWGSQTLGGENHDVVIQHDDDNEEAGYWNYYGLTQTEDLVRCLALWPEGPWNGYTGAYLNPIVGEFTGDAFDWDVSELVEVPIHLLTGGNNEGSIDWPGAYQSYDSGLGMAWSKNGQIGYLWMVASNENEPSGWQPIVFKSEDAGDSWNQIEIDYFSDEVQTMLEDYMPPVTGNDYIIPRVIESDGVVDYHGDLQLTIVADCYASDVLEYPDSLNGSAFLYNVPGDIYNFEINNDGIQQIIYVDSLNTRNLDDSANDTEINYAGSYGWTHRLNISKNDFENEVFITWSDSRIEEEDAANIEPDIFVWSRNIHLEETSDPVCITEGTLYEKFYFFTYAAEYVMYNEETMMYTIPMAQAVSPGEFAGNTELDPITMYYVDGIEVPAIGDYVATNELDKVVNFQVSQNQPNPFTGATTIEVKTQNTEQVLVEVSNIMGQTIYTMDAGSINGTKKITLTSDNMEAGIYFYTVTVGEESVTKKMIVE